MMPDGYYIERQNCMSDIRDQLTALDGEKHGGHLLIYGPCGSGKTTAISQCLRHLVLERGYFSRGGVLWIYIGVVFLSIT